jgi:hypothetical protein
MSDVEVIDSSDSSDSDVDEVAEYKPIECKRGVQKFWKVENKVSCIQYIKGKLTVSSFHCLDADIIGAACFQVVFRMQKEKPRRLEFRPRFIPTLGRHSVRGVQYM